jgi:hypothetical protein
MSRFEKFQNIQVFNAENEPLNEQIFIHDCIINFEDGFISDWYNEYEGEANGPAIDCIDGYSEHWENGVIKNNSAVFPPVDNELCEKCKYLGTTNFYNKDLLMQKGNEAEFALAKYFNKKKIPFMHLGQSSGELYSGILRKNNIKRPDYLIFIDKKPVFIEVKATSCYSINKKELERLNALKNEFQINVIFAITDISKKKFIKYQFMSLDELNKYIEIKKNKDNGWNINYSQSLLKDEIIFNNFNNEELEKIYRDEKDSHDFSKSNFYNILKSYIEENNYTMKKRNKKRNNA